MVEAALQAEIEAVLSRYAAFWNARSLPPIADLWDADDAPFVCSRVEAPAWPMRHMRRNHETQVDPAFRNGE